MTFQITEMKKDILKMAGWLSRSLGKDEVGSLLHNVHKNSKRIKALKVKNEILEIL